MFRILELKLEQQNLNVEGLQCEMSGYCATIESQKMEIVELQAQLDAQLGENIDQVNIPQPRPWTKFRSHKLEENVTKFKKSNARAGRNANYC